MKLIRNLRTPLTLMMAVIFMLTSCTDQSASSENLTEPKEVSEDVAQEPAEDPAADHHVPTAAKNTIKLALLLDTSNSMDGLIEQAKSQLWKIVNALSEAKKDNEYAALEIALYEYGNDRLKSRDGYVRQVLPFTNDLDTLSQELFALTTQGGSEYCAEVIYQSLEELAWALETEGLQVIVVAGNEPFDQGERSYKDVCARALDEGIFVNTIFCGSITEGINTFWKEGAEIAKGYYGNIDMNEATVYIDTPYDEEINTLNTELNKTYIPFGSRGFDKNANMQLQDANASSYGEANTTERVIVKSKSYAFKNSSWDLVDASKEPGFDLSKISTDDLPAVMQTMSLAERKAYVTKMKTKREEIQAKIKVLADKRAKYIEAEKQKNTDPGSASLEDAIIQAIKEQAKQRKFTF